MCKRNRPTQCVRMENLVSGCGFTSRNRAQRFVAQGRARWVEAGKSIRFIESDRRHRMALLSAAANRAGYD